jgi:hypothetical protein
MMAPRFGWRYGIDLKRLLEVVPDYVGWWILSTNGGCAPSRCELEVLDFGLKKGVPGFGLEAGAGGASCGM